MSRRPAIQEPELADLQRREGMAYTLAVGQVIKCIQSPRAVYEPLTLLAAEYMWNTVMSSDMDHHCFWNDRFAIALACDLPLQKKRLAAWCALSNSFNNYWEWQTHSGFDMKKIVGVTCSIHCTVTPIIRGGIYSRLEPQDAQAICEKFSLPTKRFGLKALSEEQTLEWAEFNRKYNFNHVL